MDFLVTPAWFCLQYGHVLLVPASVRFINASTCRHVTYGTGSFLIYLLSCEWDYILVNLVPISGRFINASHDL
ncbi:hypothetical protein SLEP1_g29539 [Rubroshorea leprosula]|uniref:Uncharacterized protein n=1 Tax=Rubroshorea leprosula TaxID=152421 RepID=A0AAV5K692_9ROSI|nr:hypothetical protein SLEP1_g29539 [Rubroshorea leprosula]